ncbi:MAG: hypothetical protein H5U40_00245, partial [Polyangiaceae bacterium]|nr:hypothetical protein [Polyangiaceae bacterium]
MKLSAPLLRYCRGGLAQRVSVEDDVDCARVSGEGELAFDQGFALGARVKHDGEGRAALTVLF